MRTNILRISLIFIICTVLLVFELDPASAQTNLAGSLAYSSNQVAYKAGQQFEIYLPYISSVSSGSANQFPSLEKFSATVRDGQSEVIRGVYVRDILALSVVQQPEGNPGYIDFAIDTVTQFQTAALNDTIGLLAHNHLAGSLFFDLELGQDVEIIYGNGEIVRYELEKIKQYQVIHPFDPFSDMIDLDTGEVMSSYEVFREVYQGDEHVTFQTCIANEGISTWGRIYIMGTPIH